MKIEFFKTNWFPIVVVVLLLLAALKRNVPWSFGAPKASREKFTELTTTAPQAPSAMGVLDSPKPPSSAVPTIEESVAVPFLQRFGRVAVGEQKKFGVPASVLLACAYVNSFAGQRTGVAQANNYFGLPCTGNWDGNTATVEGLCLRKYATPWESFRDFSIFLSTQEWFGAAKKSAGRDWQRWAAALGEQPLTDVQDFGTELRQVIERYRLYELDTQN
jgi:flagellum-specific peptidoglycan hydrolase FlgJ